MSYFMVPFPTRETPRPRTTNARIRATLTDGVSGDGEFDTDSGEGVASKVSSSGEAMGAAEGFSGE